MSFITESKYRVLFVTGGVLFLILFFFSVFATYTYYSANAIDRYYFKRFTLPVWGENIGTHKFSTPKAEITDSPLLFYNYTIQSGDSLWNLAKKFNISIDTIVSYNNPKKVHVIPVNTKIKIPFIDGIFHQQTNQPAGLSQLAEEYRVPIERLRFFNPKFHTPSSAAGTTPTYRIFMPGAYFNLSQRMEKLGAEFLKPIKEIYITSRFGLRIHPITKKRTFHKGIDLRGRMGSPVFSAKGGRVIFAGSSKNGGKLIIIKHKKGFETHYAHLSTILVKSGQRISTQTVIGKVGQSGRSTGPHLHFEIRKNGRAIDPRDVTDFH